jgi:hypothetical protein
MAEQHFSKNDREKIKAAIEEAELNTSVRSVCI